VPTQAQIPLQTEALIVGGGPAGLATAIALRQRGISCVVVESRTPAASDAGLDKPCGEGLLPDALLALAQLGIALPPDAGHPFTGIRFVNPTHSVAASFAASAGRAIGLRRTELHRLLAERAIAAGATLLFGHHLTLPEQPAATTAHIDGKPIGFRWLIGADGRASTVRRWAGLDHKRESLRFGSRLHFRIAPWCPQVEVHWAPIGQIYITPVAADSVGIAFVARTGQPAPKDFLAHFPAVAQRLAGAALLSRQQGAVSANTRLRHITRQHIALVGDASGSVDSITGEGLALAFRQSIALAESIATGALAAYPRQHACIMASTRRMARALLLMDRFPAIASMTLRLFDAWPTPFALLLALHSKPKAPRTNRLIPSPSRRRPQNVYQVEL